MDTTVEYDISAARSGASALTAGKSVRRSARESARRSAGVVLSRLHLVLYFLDICALLAIAALVFRSLEIADRERLAASYAAAAALAALIYTFFAFNNKIYDWKNIRCTLRQPKVTFESLAFTFGSLLIVGFSLRITSEFSRLWAGFWMVGFASYLLATRLALDKFLSSPSKQGVFGRKAVIVGAGENGHHVLERMRTFDRLGIQIVGFLDDRSEDRITLHPEVPVLGRTHHLAELVRYGQVDLVIIALPWSAYKRIDCLVRRLSTWSVDIYLATDKLGLEYSDRPMHRVGGTHMLGLKDRPIGEWNAVIKRIEDLCIAVPALVLLSPLMALVALAIKLESKGPVFFVQKRYGFSGNLIDVYKFRSMYTERQDPNAETLATRDDPRVTRVGRIIRRTSLDELPQLFNVVAGSMSIVGPRPHAIHAKAADQLYDRAVDDYASRHRVKPGITGWAQCNGWRGETDTVEKIQKRVEHDLYYIENWSVFLDVVIVFKTLMLLFKKDANAY